MLRESKIPVMEHTCTCLSICIAIVATSLLAQALPYRDFECAARRYTDDLLEVAKNGLPKTDDPKHVIMVGAGISGLTAAKLLKDAGHKVTMLEVSPRAGGRICTWRDRDIGIHAELGASRISISHRFVKAYVDKFNLKTRNITGYDGHTWVYLNGRKIRRYIADKYPDRLGFDTAPREKGKTSDQLLKEAMKEIVNDCVKCDEMDLQCLKHYDHYSYQEFLTEVAGLSKGAISMTGAMSEEVSFYFGVSETADYTADYYKADRYDIEGGNDMLPKAFLPDLEEDIILNARVTQIEHGSGSVVAHYSTPDNETEDIQVSGDYLITTATAPATTFIKFTPQLSPDTREAFRNIHYVSATKIILVFTEPFWKREGIRGGLTRTDLSVVDILYPTHDFPSGHGVLTASYVAADHSDKLLSQSNEKLIQVALNDVAEVHGEYIKELYVEGMVKRWELDPYAVGGYPCFTPYQLTNYQGPISRPTNEIFFAGEHAALPHGWIDTAMKSGIEAANCLSTKRCHSDYSNENPE